MVTEGIVLGHKISTIGLEVDQAKIYLIKTLIPPTTVKGIKSFLSSSQNFQDHCADCWRRMQSLNLMNHAVLHLRRSKLNW